MAKWAKLILLVALSIVAFLGVIVSQKKSVEEVVDMRLNMDYEILHMEEIENKTIVLARVGNGEAQFVIVKRGLLANLAIYDGTFTDLDIALSKIGIYFFEVPKSHMENKLICFGFLEKDEISSLTLSDQTDASNAKITNLDEYAFWIADATNIKMRQIIINGYDAESKHVLEYEEILKGN